MKKRALISLSDKTGLQEFATSLYKLGYEIISTGGTAAVLKSYGIPVINVSDLTGFPECLDGRVKTLHPLVHAGILAVRDNPSHMQQIAKLGINPIDIVAINLYPFKETIMKKNVSMEEAIENIDIGGPSMLRGAAKNFQDVTVIVDPADYSWIIEDLSEKGFVSHDKKLALAAKVFEHTAAYDALIANYMRKQTGLEGYPEKLTLTFEKSQDMRYGENPHQTAAFYHEMGNGFEGTVAAAKQLWGKELSYNNINDVNGALKLLKEFDEDACVAVKHANPCGVGTGTGAYDCYKKAYDADPVSIFGGIVAINCAVDKQTAEEMAKIFLEIIIAPEFSPEALEVLKAKKNLRLLCLPKIREKNTPDMLEMKKVSGGLLIQSPDTVLVEEEKMKVVTNAEPDEAQMKDMLFAMKVVKHVKSNAIVLAKDGATLGIGPGQTNRITALELAIKYAQGKANGAVMASDAFFPFDDCVEAAAKAGITAIIQPGGSIRDEDSINACNRHGIAMVFTGIRHFQH